ncbi:dTDP-glucose pyrophosphorylase [Paenibacillus cellulosilyticus]|uniref:dTDP-glucose pyrophosphorylase n=1 Tax=Paenibacillus cellulosilyticus TaxID=375489 RepID=A0A2V2YUU2_9BACL|nr:glycosyltransferase family 2 protein [Paenibacillus cellulosilyticus]PWW03220.1 dTDP-glucose pyrophosphorylase [Paenibacillus cellulosilyticus]QKS43709.1 NTP transferase domain-containing protein [Paenibacillus cellulosilyticus]
MNIVIPIAGAGSRFQSAGYREPKMLIQVAGRPMLHWALDSLLPSLIDNRFIFVALREVLERTTLRKVILSRCPEAIIIPIDQPTNGQAETVWMARSVLDSVDSLLIFNGDTYVGTEIGKKIKECPASVEGLINVFPSSDPAYSYVDLDSNELVRSVREKKVISAWATSGLYYFRSTAAYLELMAQVLDEPMPPEGEWYVAPLYERMIAQGCRIGVDYALFCHPLGTPKQLQAFTEHVVFKEESD